MTTQPLDFSLERWQQLVKDAGTHHVARESDKKPGRIACTDFVTPKGEALLCLFKDKFSHEFGMTYHLDGRSTGLLESADECLIIVPNPLKSLGWVGIYKGEETGILYESNRYDTREKLLSTRFTFLAIHEFKEGDGLTEAMTQPMGEE